jgi:NAD(P)-dependent dehydrogenase (short-subunit alcohol dehydrogenase family)
MTYTNTATADDVLADIDLNGKTALITGASGGLGEETARALAARGAQVTIVARTSDKLAAAADRILQTTGRQVEIDVLELDKPESIRQFAERWCQQHQALDILINNAGIMMCPLSRTPQGWELQFATNHLGHFLLTNLLAEPLKRSGNARVVTVASSAHNVASINFDDIHYQQRDYCPIDAYGQSKTANIWFSTELDHRWKLDGVRAFSLHPGGIQTDLGRQLTPDVMAKLMSIIQAGSPASAENSGGGKTIPQGAATSCYAAVSPQLDDEGGLYLVDCSPAIAGDHISHNHAIWAYDKTGASRLWDLSNEMLGTRF